MIPAFPGDIFQLISCLFSDDQNHDTLEWSFQRNGFNLGSDSFSHNDSEASFQVWKLQPLLWEVSSEYRKAEFLILAFRWDKSTENEQKDTKVG